MSPVAACALACIVLGAMLLAYWRFFYFFRDPERKTPGGRNLVAPADGRIVYIKRITKGEVPIAVKERREIRLEEITKTDYEQQCADGYIIGIFMSDLDVHVNRAPIAGQIGRVAYFKGSNLGMFGMLFRSFFGKGSEVYAKSNYILQNERNTICIRGEIPVYVIQIAEVYVNRIECWVREGQSVAKGSRVGRIIMGSQVDVVFPFHEQMEIDVKLGDRVKAGETVLARW